MKTPFIRIGAKTVRLDDLPEEAWEFLVGGPNQPPDLRKYYREVAWLNRAARLRANHVARVPFKIMRGEKEVDTSDDYQNAITLLPKPRRLLWLVEMGLTLGGMSYQLIERRSVMGRGLPVGLRNLKASTIKPVYAKEQTDEFEKGEIMYFERRIGGKPEPVELDEMVYFYAPDDDVEIGPPESWPALAALQAAGLLYSVSGFATMFFDRGAIKVTLLATHGPVIPSERSKIKAWWEKIRGNAWSAEIVNADDLDVIPVGEGLDSLENTELTTEQREDISTAMGVPHSMLFSNAANYATSQQDKLNFYEDTIIPECDVIQDVLNTQYLEPYGVRLVFDPNELPIFQEDEEQRSASMYNLVAAGWRPSIAGETLGYNLPDGVDYAALDEKYDLEIEQRRMSVTPAPGVSEDTTDTSTATDDITEGSNPRQVEKSLARIDLEKWERKALKRIQRGNDPACTFDSEYIPLITVATIEGALEATTNKPDLVRELFSDVWTDYP